MIRLHHDRFTVAQNNATKNPEKQSITVHVFIRYARNVFLYRWSKYLRVTYFLF